MRPYDAQWVDAATAGSASCPGGGVPVTASSGNVAAATATATLAALAGKFTYIQGALITSGGATVALCVVGTIAGIVGGTMSFIYGAGLGAAIMSAPLQMSFGAGIPSSAVNTAIVVSMPTLGLGNLNAAIFAWGYQL